MFDKTIERKYPVWYDGIEQNVRLSAILSKTGVKYIMGKETLTNRQQQIFNFIKETILKKGYPPTVREICEGLNISSTASVHAQLEILERKNYIHRDPSKPRTIEITDDEFNLAGRDMVNVPMVRYVAAEEPILAAQNIEGYFPVPSDHLPNAETFMLKVQDESMIKSGILAGDYVLVEMGATVKSGNKVAVMIEGSASVRTYYAENGLIRLQPENDYMDPSIVHGDPNILGKVVGVLRLMR